METVNKGNRLVLVVGMISRFILHKDEALMVPLFKFRVRPVLDMVMWCGVNTSLNISTR